MNNTKNLEALKILFSKMIETLNAKREAAVAQMRREQEQMYQNQRAMELNRAMNQMLQELFVIFSANTYSLLKPVSVINDIIPAGYRTGGKYVLFDFRLVLTDQRDVLSVVLAQIKEKMNHDIYCFQQLQGSGYLEEAFMLYPFTMAGLRVVEARQNGIFLNIAVITRNIS